MKPSMRVLPIAAVTALTLAGCSGSDDKPAETTEAGVPGVTVLDVPVDPLTTVGGVPVQASAYGSAWTPVPGTTDEFYGLTDRGPNVDGVADDQKVEPVPDFVPKIGRFTIDGDTLKLVSTIELTGTDGKPFNGQVDPAANTGETIVDLDGRVLPQSDHGFDPEGLVALPDGTFWISDEYGPFLLHADAQGKEIERLAPGRGLRSEIALRSPNQGMEGLTITPDGSTLVGILQSGLKSPGLDGSAKKVPLTRIVTVNLASKAVREYAYVLDNPEQTGKAVSEITAISDTEFLTIERDGKLAPGANKVVYTIDIAGATDIGPDATVGTYVADAGGLQIDGKALETLIGVTNSDAAQQTLTAAGITPVTKEVAVDLGKLVDELDPEGKIFGHDKIEGLATTDGGKTLYISNDSDFGLGGLANDAPPYTLKPKTLANGNQDSGEILVIDTTKLSN